MTQKENMPTIGARVLLCTLLKEGLFPGSIVGVSPGPGHGEDAMCEIKLDCQDDPIRSVLYYHNGIPDLINSCYWQACAPESVMERDQREHRRDTQPILDVGEDGARHAAGNGRGNSRAT